MHELDRTERFIALGTPMLRLHCTHPINYALCPYTGFVCFSGMSVGARLVVCTKLDTCAPQRPRDRVAMLVRATSDRPKGVSNSEKASIFSGAPVI